MTLDKIYHFVRRLMFEFLIYFLLQSLLLIVLAIIILIFPYSLNVLVSLFFLVSALIGIYVVIRVAILFHKIKKLKDIVTG
jgi:hypothetical protein